MPETQATPEIESFAVILKDTDRDALITALEDPDRQEELARMLESPAIQQQLKNTLSQHLGSIKRFSDESWMSEALCGGMQDTFIFVHEISENAQNKVSKKRKEVRERIGGVICSLCDVGANCLSYGMNIDDGEYDAGVFGGLDPNDRRAYARQRAREKRRIA